MPAATTLRTRWRQSRRAARSMCPSRCGREGSSSAHTSSQSAHVRAHWQLLRWARALAPPAPSLAVVLLRAVGAAAAGIAADIAEAAEVRAIAAAGEAAPGPVVDDCQRFATWDAAGALAVLRGCLSDGDAAVAAAAAGALERITSHCRAAYATSGVVAAGACVGDAVMGPLLLSGTVAALAAAATRRLKAAAVSRDAAAAEVNIVVDVLLHEAAVRACGGRVVVPSPHTHAHAHVTALTSTSRLRSLRRATALMFSGAMDAFRCCRGRCFRRAGTGRLCGAKFVVVGARVATFGIYGICGVQARERGCAGHASAGALCHIRALRRRRR